MKNYHYLYVFCLLISLPGWQAIKTTSLDNAAWLTGTWENKTQRGMIYETWTKINTTELAAKSYSLKNGDTLVFENVQLVQKQGTLFYIPTVKNQNNNQPVSFSLKSFSADHLVFENAGHDFPQIISYKRIAQDSLVAEISGTVNGKDRKQAYHMKRIK